MNEQKFNFIFSQEAAKLKAEGVNIIIALGHSGLDKDKQIAADCPEIDLIIGGHCKCFDIKLIRHANEHLYFFFKRIHSCTVDKCQALRALKVITLSW